MLLKNPKNTEKYQWTQHSIYKMRQYGLSEQKIRGVLRNPFRREEGIVKKTIAVMQPVSVKIKNGKKVWSQEIWVMFQRLKTKCKIISAWRYPGVSPKNNPIPEDILREISQLN